MGDNKRVLVIINPAAGHDEPIINILNAVFSEHGVDYDVQLTRKFGDATELAKAGVSQGYDVIAGYGGDGTQMEVANGVMGSEVPMGILPGGTGNAMAFELNIPRDLRAAATLICTSSRIQAVDVGKANDTFFMLRLYSGVEEEQKTSRDMKDKYGVLAYPVSTLEMTRNLNHSDYRLTIDGEVIEETGVSLMVANAGSTGGISLSFAGDIDVTDGLLDAFMVDTSLSSLRAATSRFLHLPTKQAGLHFWQGKEIIVEADPPQTVWVDGELLGPTPVTITAVPGAVNIVVPEIP